MRSLNLDKLFLIVIPSFVFSQTTNTGDFYIKEGTQVSSVGVLDNKTSGMLINDGELVVYSHFNNEGVVSFTKGKQSGLTIMNGFSDYQDISGSIPIELNNVKFNSNKQGAVFHLSNYLSIFGTSDFYNGIVDDDSYGGLVIFEKGSSHIHASDKSFVDGEVRKNGKKSFVFPIGDDLKYRYAGISAPDEDNDSFTGKYFFKNPDVLYPFKNKEKNISIINNKEYWEINKVSGVSNIILSLSFDDITTPEDIIDKPDDIHIVRWDSGKNMWLDEGGIIDFENRIVSSPVNVKEYGVFTTAKVVNVLSSVIVYNAISPNDDGLNDYLRIEGLDGTENTLEIYNRWGVKVFETADYGRKGNVFDGFSHGRSTITKKEKLPAGTYFYTLSVNKDNSNIKKSGYLYINNN